MIKRVELLWRYKIIRIVCWVLIVPAIFVFLIVVIPCLINYLILQPQQFNIVGDGTTWLSFWVTYIGAVASFAMVFITWWTLIQNKKQLNELKRQWEEQNRARISFSIISSQLWYDLKITNIGKENAFNINVKFNDNFINNISDNTFQNYFKELQNNPFSLEAGCSKYLTICRGNGALMYWSNKCQAIEINGMYCNKYEINTKVALGEYMLAGMVHNDELTTIMGYIKKGIIVQNDSYMPIQKSLDMIANKIDKIQIEDNNVPK